MTARTRTRKAATVEVEIPDVIDHETGVTADEAVKAPKYFSHANCDHPRKGDAGKAARAACRRAIRTWLNAEAEFLQEDKVAV